MKLFPKLALGAITWEGSWWLLRRFKRRGIYQAALRRAGELQRPLVVIGAPDLGPTAGPGCGDITVDLDKSSCPHAIRADITKLLPLANDSSVIFVSCVLEYVEDFEAAKREILRVAGGCKNVFVCRVEPWTLTAYLYPGAHRRVATTLCEDT